MSISVEFIYMLDFSLTPDQEKTIKALFAETARRENRTSGEVSLTFCDNDFIHDLNRTYRNIDRPTDVLSFPMEDEQLLGDIVISIPKVRSQAEEYGHSFERELYFLAVHGFLHLLGYDHETKEDEEIMFGKQEQILSDMGIRR